MKTIAVIGGGITGLSAMHELQKLKKEHGLDAELILIEKEKALGGKIRTVKQDGYIMETGADSIVARHQSVSALIDELGLKDRAVYNATGISYLYANNELHAIPEDTVFGIPMSEDALFSSTLVSEEGKREALKDFETANETFTRDSSVGEFLEAFLGKELVENQVAPVLSGVYSGKLSDLTLASTLPYLLDYKNEYGSIIKGLAANKTTFQAAANKKFLSFDEGLSVLIDRLEEELTDVTILKGTEPKSLNKRDDRYEIALDGRTIEADHVLLAVPHQTAQTLLSFEKLSPAFEKLKNSSLITVYLGFDLPDSILPANGTGFITAQGSDLACNACTWTSRKWPHTSKDGKLLIRLFYKSSSPSYEKMKQMTKEELVAAAMTDVEKSLGLQEQPSAVEVTDWAELMPNYHLGHQTAVSELEMKLAGIAPGVRLAGASFYGVGIGACIENGKAAAISLAGELENQ